MPGIFTHMLVARRLLRSDQSPVSRRDEGSFYLGTVFPDLGYWPGNDPFPSDLAHYVGSHAVPHHLYETSDHPTVRSFAAGWLLHVWLDILGHALVNRFAAESSDTDRELLTFEDDRSLHVQVENGLDIQVLAALDPFSELPLSPPHQAIPEPVCSAFRHVYDHEIPEARLEEGLTKLPKQVRFLRNLFRVQASSPRVRALKLLFLPLKALVGEGTKDLIDAFSKPFRPNPGQWERYEVMMEEALAVFQDGNGPAWPDAYHNLDTGQVSRRGDYLLADRAFDEIDGRMTKLEKVEERAASVRNWGRIKAGFLDV